ncbi:MULTISPECIES: hypothetical protein [Neisseriaceae]|uniref:Uncharacterized protein n=1 Tax=Eikenella corrodens CC92I TaxID=1073362 RepID=V7I8X3_EIKCO|nr:MULTISPECIES: hypothetical protein [Neisseriaceae]ETA82640.1 hypothetical protein HMPREF1177_02158 [Eikenella corrodens CC92I]DAJ54333.1 MAG TPA: hypothetical protein [Caudoviricetes sp.]DAX91464.1 MAG TPA: hypothetical protein [Caudoviricetes sp.]
MVTVAKFIWYLASIVSGVLVLTVAAMLLVVVCMAAFNRYDDIFINREQS